MTNKDRAEAGRKTLESYSQRHYFRAPRFATPERIDAERKEVAIDLLTDLLHHLHAEGVEVDGLLDLCMRHFKSELEEEAA